ncbi:Helix-turn-helix domain of resolvase [Roseateles sp. YR242]|uniref:helix-turn-helix domain-containing protein n=1 Tax=Roseateles sp. YR242 TaxID=1855305 RepID=UPI0008C24616|nr:helix-turn-helix domain-containing protein [Roseateles sp. YR242]SEL12353.1 Helix-turn-helix domain of resolvase [Roseateles sp. YR242]
MGRPSKLTEQQWAEIQKRLLAGEKAADLAREFKVSKTRISERFSERNGTVKAVANQIVEADAALRRLPVTEQIAALTLADELKAISKHLASAAKYGAATAHRLSGIAHAKVQEIDDAAPLDDESRGALRDVAVLTKLANDSAEIPMSLLQANKDLAKEINQQAKPIPQRITVEVVDASNPDAET